MTMTPSEASTFASVFDSLVGNVGQAVLGKPDTIRLVLTAMFAGGHVLLEDAPGTGKTMLARALAASLKVKNSRIQFTPDLLPSDVTGVTIYEQSKGRFEFHPGPIFATIVLAAFASYAIVRNWDRRFFRYSFFYLLAAMFIPFPVVALPQIQLTGRVGLDNPMGVIILATMFQLSFSVLLFTAFLRSIPIELEESARIDGATTWQTFWRLIFPLLAPMSATVGIFAFLYAWNDFMMPSLIISDPNLQTLPVRQNLFQNQFSNNYNVAFASYLMAMAPAIVAYLFTQRWVMEGVTQGAVKG